ncbi:class I SAM-dependent methyltransferase [Ruminococcus albus]|uniref:tRNA (Cmo5U34)-methyltransferase n=1 Tax=Ruminococcus albus TaxID=1264 RepID=A0A1I1QRD4_RUMAL|nr:class I SAM-dependent methyltransferase [Ruminococcus albus]SFD22408.1 tRNA (cmo5U34)-methyltransferase [Ruminococcus albus]
MNQKNKTPFKAAEYDMNVRKVIPMYDIIYDQIFDLIKTVFPNKKIALLDTGCGSGNLGVRAVKDLELSDLVLCDPSQDMLNVARSKVTGNNCKFIQIGSENLDYEECFDIVTAIQCHGYFDREGREKAVKNCFRALKNGGLFICFENTAPFTETGRDIMLSRVENFGRNAGRSEEEVKAHSARYGTDFFPLTIREHMELLNKTGFSSAEIFWHSYMQSGFYGIKR